MPEGDRDGRIRLWHILALALALRLVALAIPAMAHPDEIFQYLEPAHRLLFGRGVVTWEWRYGMRSWLVPFVVAGPMAIGAAIDPGGALYLVLPKLVMTIASLMLVTVAWRLGERLSRRHAIVAATVAAIWYEFVFFAPHILSDTIALLLILPAAAILVARERWSERRLIVAGLLLGLAALVRFQLCPAIGTLAIACCGLRLREGWRPLVIGGAIGLLPGIAADLAMHQLPFGWLAENVRLNLLEGRAATYGASGPFGYLPMMLQRWWLWGVPILLFAGLGARRYPALAWTAAINLGFHMLIAHKEYRFVLLSATLAILLAAIGSVDWAQGGSESRDAARTRRRLAIASIGWTVASASLAFGNFLPLWVANGADLGLYARLRSDPQLCGIAIYRHDFSMTGGYTYLHRDVPMYLVPNQFTGDLAALLAQQDARFNTVLTTPDHASELPTGYGGATCMGAGNRRVCLYRRPGPCSPAASSPIAIDAALRRIDS